MSERFSPRGEEDVTSGSWMIGLFFDGLAFLGVPWLAGMVILFVAEFVEGNTITRLHFMRLHRMTRVALEQGHFTPEFEIERGKRLPSFTHDLDLPGLALIIARNPGPDRLRRSGTT